MDYFGDLGLKFKERYKSLGEKDKKLARIILRSSIKNKLMLDDNDFSKEEFSELMGILFEKDLNTNELNILYEKRT